MYILTKLYSFVTRRVFQPMLELLAIMASQSICPNCGSSRIGPSPSGFHLVCSDCQRIMIQERVRKPRGRKPRSKFVRPESSSIPEARKGEVSVSHCSSGRTRGKFGPWRAYV